MIVDEYESSFNSKSFLIALINPIKCVKIAIKLK